MAGSFLGFNLPFGMSNANNNTPAAPNAQQGNPNFPASNQMQRKNEGADPTNMVAGQQGNNEPNNNQDNNPDPNKGKGDSQLDNFKDFFKVPVNDKGEPVVQQNPLEQPIMQVDQAKLRELASKTNFTSGITAEVLQTAMSDPSKMLQLLNQVAQNGFATALQASTTMVEGSIQRYNERVQQHLPDQIRTVQIHQTQAKHPALLHPSVQPMLAMLKQQVASTNPQLSPEQVATTAEGFILAMNADMTASDTKTRQQNQPKNPSDVDWMATLTGNP